MMIKELICVNVKVNLTKFSDLNKLQIGHRYIVVLCTKLLSVVYQSVRDFQPPVGQPFRTTIPRDDISGLPEIPIGASGI